MASKNCLSKIPIRPQSAPFRSTEQSARRATSKSGPRMVSSAISDQKLRHAVLCSSYSLKVEHAGTPVDLRCCNYRCDSAASRKVLRLAPVRRRPTVSRLAAVEHPQGRVACELAKG